MFASLRFRLIGSYVAIIFLCLILAGSAIVIVLRDYQERVRLDQLAELSYPISMQVQTLELLGRPSAQIAQALREPSDMLGVRIILADREGLVIEDTGGDLEGRQVHLPAREGVERRARSFRSYYYSTEGGLFLIAPQLGDARRPSSYVVILAVPQATVAQAWWELAPSLSVAAIISLVVSILVALFLSRSIARPLIQMTRASEEMARGRYEQSIPVRGRDEVGRLAVAFNEMANQIATSDRTMRDFLANVSHELKTPLTSIHGFSQAMLDGTIRQSDEYHQAAAIINQESVAMRRLVDDLLTLSKIESGQIAMRDEVVDIDRVLRDAARRAEWHAEGAHVQLRVDGVVGATVRGDLYWLTQVFSNLLDNALKHTPSGGEVTVHAAVEHERSDVAVSVHNTGSFIPAEDLSRVFERFFQVDRSRSTRERGSGLGLAIVREVVQAHNGSVFASSSRAEGTTFTVRLPLHSLAVRPPITTALDRVA